jgi:hypothetical protein
METEMTKLSLEQLKAMVYDHLVMLEQTQKNLQLLNEEIKSRGEKNVRND